MLVTANLEAVTSSKALLLQQVPYIWYLKKFAKSRPKIQVLMDFGSKVNIITPGFVLDLGLCI